MDKRLSLKDMVAQIAPGQSVAFGGGGLQRKPIAAVKAIAASTLTDIPVVAFLGGPDVDILVGLGKVARLSFCFVGFDAWGLAPNFRKAREAGTLEIVEYSEATMIAAFEAGAKRLPFIPTRFGLGSQIMRTRTSPFREFDCPLTGERLVAVPAINPDVAIVHVNEADRAGNAVIHSDCYSDPLLVRAAKRTFLTAERVVDKLAADQTRRSTFISRLWVHGVVEAPRGAGLSIMYPDYALDLPRVLEYQKRATDAAWLNAFVAEAA
jgi:glutaconate CoA-transferase subunit A